MCMSLKVFTCSQHELSKSIYSWLIAVSLDVKFSMLLYFTFLFPHWEYNIL